MTALTVVTVTYSPVRRWPSSWTRWRKRRAARSTSFADNVRSTARSTPRAPPRRAGRPTGGNVGYGGRSNIGVAASSGEFVVIVNPDVVWEPGSPRRAARRSDPLAAGRLAGSVDQDTGRHGLSVGAGAAFARTRHRPRAVRVVVALEPVTASYRRERGDLGEGPNRLLSGSCLLVRRARSTPSPASIRPTSCTSRRRPRRAAGQGRLAERVRADRGRRPYRWTRDGRDPARMAVEHHRSAWIYLASRYPGRRWAPLRWVPARRAQGRSLLARRVRSVAQGGARSGANSPLAVVIRRGSAIGIVGHAAHDEGDHGAGDEAVHVAPDRPPIRLR